MNDRRHQCAICRLRHTELLDAAHIVPDADPRERPQTALLEERYARFRRTG
jgi:HNH endonuclease